MFNNVLTYRNLIVVNGHITLIFVLFSDCVELTSWLGLLFHISCGSCVTHIGRGLSSAFILSIIVISSSTQHLSRSKLE